MSNVLIFISFGLLKGQISQGMTFQAIFYDKDNKVLPNREVAIKFTILKGSKVLLAERHTYTTSSNGLVSIILVKGTVEWGE